MTEEKDNSTNAGSSKIVTESEPPNPLEKLISGFCSPKNSNAPGFDDNDDDDVNAKYAPDLGSQNPTADTATTSDETSSQSSSTNKSVEQDSLDVTSNKLAANRTKRGLENFIMACIFVLGTLLTLKKLGFTTSDFGLTTSGMGKDSSSWINVVDKASIEDTTEETSIDGGDDAGKDVEGEDASTETVADEL